MHGSSSSSVSGAGGQRRPCTLSFFLLLGTACSWSACAFQPAPRAPVFRRGLPSLRMAQSIPITGAPAKAEEATGERKRFYVQIGDRMLDLTGWRNAHPAGSRWIDRYAGQDATDIMYAIHSDEAVDMMQRLPAAKDGPEPVEPSALTKSFREFRGKLKAEGWFKRQWYHEAGLLSAQLGTMAAATILAKMGMTLPALAVLSIAHTTGGWMAHDFVHGRGKWCSSMRHFGAFAIGLSSKWWSEKHNTHHAHTNVIGIDEDIMVEPAIWLWAPDSARDRPWRRFQHLFFPLAFSLTFAIWRIDSVKTVIREKLWVEGAALAFHYAALLWAVGPMLAFSHIFIAGAFTATMVTVTHTSEELLTEHEPSFVDAQFRTTRDAKCHDPISQYLWGGMQYQLEHHLFPTMPRYKYPSLAPVLQKWAESNGLEYRVTDQWKIIADNIKLLRDVAKAPSEEGSPHPQLGKISSGAL